jgi:hypothetical protein
MTDRLQKKVPLLTMTDEVLGLFFLPGPILDSPPQSAVMLARLSLSNPRLCDETATFLKIKFYFNFSENLSAASYHWLDRG